MCTLQKPVAPTACGWFVEGSTSFSISIFIYTHCYILFSPFTLLLFCFTNQQKEKRKLYHPRNLLYHIYRSGENFPIFVCIINHLYQINFSFNHQPSNKSFSVFPYTIHHYIYMYRKVWENYYVYYTISFSTFYLSKCVFRSFIFIFFSSILPFIMFHAFVLLILYIIYTHR